MALRKWSSRKKSFIPPLLQEILTLSRATMSNMAFTLERTLKHQTSFHRKKRENWELVKTKGIRENLQEKYLYNQ